MKENDECHYTQLSWDKAKDGTWKIEDNKIIVSGVLDYDIYAEIGDSRNALLFQSDNSRWSDETLIKASWI